MKAKMYNYGAWIEEHDKNILKTYFNDLLKECGHTILNYMEHDFKPQGFTGVWLLAESHFAIHTFPEDNRCYIELTSCNKQCWLHFVNNCKWI